MHSDPMFGPEATGVSGGREVEAAAVTAVRIAPTAMTRAMTARRDAHGTSFLIQPARGASIKV